MRSLLFLFVFALVSVGGQAQKVYSAAVVTVGGRQPVGGFLYQVTDSAIIIAPGHRKKDIGKIDPKKTLSIPINVVRKVVLRRVRATGVRFLQGFALGVATGVGAVLITIRYGPGPGLLTAVLAPVPVSLVYTKLTTTKLDPKDHFFREKIEEFCIVKDKRSIAAVSSPPEVK